MHSHTKFGNLISKNKRDMLLTQLLLKLGQRSSHSGPKIITPPSHDAYTHQIWNSYLKEYKSYAPNTKILKTRSEVKVTVTWNVMCDTLSSQDAFRHHIWNSYLKKYRRLGQRSSSRSQWLNYGTRHFVISRCIITPNLRFLVQILLEICSGHDYSNN